MAGQIIQSVDRILRLNRQLKSIEERIAQFPYSFFDHNWNFDKTMNVVKAKSFESLIAFPRSNLEPITNKGI